MDKKLANLLNLTALWEKYGSHQFNDSPLPLSINTSWPHRAWIITDQCIRSTEPKASTIKSLLNKLPKHVIVPVAVGMVTDSVTWKVRQELYKQLLADQNWQCTFKQTAMILSLQGYNTQLQPPASGFKMYSVNSIQEITSWVAIGSEAFGYDINIDVITPLIVDDSLQLYLGYLNDEPVACGLMFTTSDVTGIHQIGVKQSAQGKGVARSFMQALIEHSQNLQSNYVVLQASEQGKPLYEKMGFEEQFEIVNFQKI